MTAALRFLSLLALLLMPFGMTAAPAAPSGQHHASSAVPMEHCPDGESDMTGDAADCAMPCSAALPAAELASIAALFLNRTAASPACVRSFTGVLLEIATPPPKQA